MSECELCGSTRTSPTDQTEKPKICNNHNSKIIEKYQRVWEKWNQSWVHPVSFTDYYGFVKPIDFFRENSDEKVLEKVNDKTVKEIRMELNNYE